MTRIHAKGQGERTLGSKVRVETDGRTDIGDAIALSPVLARSVKTDRYKSEHNEIYRAEIEH